MLTLALNYNLMSTPLHTEKDDYKEQNMKSPAPPGSMNKKVKVSKCCTRPVMPEGRGIVKVYNLWQRESRRAKEGTK